MPDPKKEPEKKPNKVVHDTSAEITMSPVELAGIKIDYSKKTITAENEIDLKHAPGSDARRIMGHRDDQGRLQITSSVGPNANLTIRYGKGKDDTFILYGDTDPHDTKETRDRFSVLQEKIMEQVKSTLDQKSSKERDAALKELGFSDGQITWLRTNKSEVETRYAEEDARRKAENEKKRNSNSTPDAPSAPENNPDASNNEKPSKESLNAARNGPLTSGMSGAFQRPAAQIQDQNNALSAASKALNELDTSKDGFISPDEISKIENMKEKERNDLRNKLDINHDGKVTINEISAIKNFQGGTEVKVNSEKLVEALATNEQKDQKDQITKAAEALKTLDIQSRGGNKDGRDGDISPKELTALSDRNLRGENFTKEEQKEHKAARERMIKALDLDGDGIVTKGEIDKIKDSMGKSGVTLNSEALASTLYTGNVPLMKQTEPEQGPKKGGGKGGR